MSGTQGQLERAIGQIIDKGQVPEIDFTQHQLENGLMVSTQERVVKEARSNFLSTPHSNINVLYV